MPKANETKTTKGGAKKSFGPSKTYTLTTEDYKAVKELAEAGDDYAAESLSIHDRFDGVYEGRYDALKKKLKDLAVLPSLPTADGTKVKALVFEISNDKKPRCVTSGCLKFATMAVPRMKNGVETGKGYAGVCHECFEARSEGAAE